MAVGDIFISYKCDNKTWIKLKEISESNKLKYRRSNMIKRIYRGLIAFLYKPKQKHK